MVRIHTYARDYHLHSSAVSCFPSSCAFLATKRTENNTFNAEKGSQISVETDEKVQFLQHKPLLEKGWIAPQTAHASTGSTSVTLVNSNFGMRRSNMSMEVGPA